MAGRGARAAARPWHPTWCASHLKQALSGHSRHGPLSTLRRAAKIWQGARKLATGMRNALRTAGLSPAPRPERFARAARGVTFAPWIEEPTLDSPTVAILGASADRSKFGNKSVRAHLQAGYQVFPINPRGGQIEGLVAFARLADLPPGALHRVSVYLPPAVALTALDEVVARGCDELYLNPGSDTPEVLARARELGLAVVARCSIVDLGLRPSAFPDE